MTQIIETLREEHTNMAQMLDVLEEQVDIFHNGGTPDFDLMLQVMRYTQNYPDLFHHPKEDLVYKKLVKRDRRAAAVVDDLLQEHEEMRWLAQEFAMALHHFVLGAAPPGAWFEKLARDYIAFSHRHMDKEETALFPAALRALKEEDWAEIDRALTSPEHSLFSPKVQEQYLELHERIVHSH